MLTDDLINAKELEMAIKVYKQTIASEIKPMTIEDCQNYWKNFQEKHNIKITFDSNQSITEPIKLVRNEISNNN